MTVDSGGCTASAVVQCLPPTPRHGAAKLQEPLRLSSFTLISGLTPSCPLPTGLAQGANKWARPACRAQGWSGYKVSFYSRMAFRTMRMNWYRAEERVKGPLSPRVSLPWQGSRKALTPPLGVSLERKAGTGPAVVPQRS